jgi:hypothetical protein
VLPSKLRVPPLAGLGIAVAFSILSACYDYSTPYRNPDPPDGTSVDVAFCGGLEPAWLAFQDGDGPFTQALPTSSNGNRVFRHTFTSNRAAVAMTTLLGGGMTLVQVQYGTPAELAIVGVTAPKFCGPNVTKTLLGTIAGVDASETVTVTAGFFSRSAALSPARTEFAIDGLADGPQDLLATRTALVGGVPTITGMILRRDIDLPDSASVSLIDFASAEVFAPAVASVTVNGLVGDAARVGTLLLTSSSEIAIQNRSTTDVTRPFFALPEARLRPADLVRLTASTSAAATGSARTAILYFRSPVDQTLNFGAPLVAPTLSTVATTPALRLRARFVDQPEYDRSASVGFQQGENRLFSVSMTAAYAALSTNGFDLTVPDLSGAMGFDPAWALQANGSSLFWNAGRVGGTLGLGPNAVPFNGARQVGTFGSGSITP